MLQPCTLIGYTAKFDGQTFTAEASYRCYDVHSTLNIETIALRLAPHKYRHRIQVWLLVAW